MDKTQADPRIGAVLGGRYRITTLLGEGGMGLVYRGERLQLGKPVAIKFLHSPYARSPKFVARFEREARAMSKLSHPHCVSVIDFGVQDAPYIVMDFVTGHTLRELLDDGATILPPRALSIVRQVLFGLAHAHAEGVVHRDIKPGNIMLGELTGIGDHVRIFDFGLAKLHDSEADGDVSAAHVVGTPAYMAPEQARADKIDQRVDLYATGVLLFELLTGEKPFQADDAYTVLMMQRDKAPPLLRSVRPDFSTELEAVVSRALEKDVSKRFQNAAEFVAALEAVPETTGRPSSTEKDLNSAALGIAKTEHQLRSPIVGQRLDKIESERPPARRTNEGSLAGTPSRATPAPRRGAFWLWLVAALGALGVLGFVMLRRPSSEPASEAQPGVANPAPTAAGSAPLAAGEPTEPREPVAAAAPAVEPEAIQPLVPLEPGAPAADPGAAAAEPGGAEPIAAPDPVAAEPANPAPSGAEAAPGEPAVEEELSEAALAAADEALNEASEPEVELPASAPSVTTLAGVHQLIKQQKLDEAINALRVLRKKTPKNAELPYLLADLYFDRGWWSDGLAKYREAIRINRNYRTRVSVQRNAIRSLADDRTYPRARLLLAKDVGRVALARLRKAAKSDPSKVVRKRASSVLARM
jgi:serine/threonine-protein kinase